ncbi:unnamed protein product, partial [Laminaria digitata]
LKQEPLTTGEHVAEGATAPSAVLARHKALLQQLEESKAQLAQLALLASPNTKPTAPQTTRPAAAVPTVTRPIVSAFQATDLDFLGVTLECIQHTRHPAHVSLAAQNVLGHFPRRDHPTVADAVARTTTEPNPGYVAATNTLLLALRQFHSAAGPDTYIPWLHSETPHPRNAAPAQGLPTYPHSGTSTNPFDESNHTNSDSDHSVRIP